MRGECSTSQKVRVDGREQVRQFGRSLTQRAPIPVHSPLGYNNNDRMLAMEWDDTSETNLTANNSAVSCS
ncbi:Uncharacterized protein DAT39_007600 [Clarias magur]|uniref:Uncharacterized protein n=1 Tax=Clarias magur TaxID=1594786 RepID=A0A8J4U997_CLAMG|nr:Uncharacterized protein DAT39_007600 [Clarias magur]